MSRTEVPGLRRFTTGLPGLDVILGGGFLIGGVYIIQGTPGTGKTTLANQIAFNHAAGGGQALYTTLLAEYHGRMMQHLSDMSFFDTSKIPDQVNYLNGFGVLREQGFHGLRDLLRREIAKHRASVLILDGFATVQRTAPEVKDFNAFVHELQGIAMATECTVFLLSSSMGVKETPEYTIVDGIVELRDQLLGWSSESSLQVVKLRGTSCLRGRHAYRITNDGLVVYPRIESLLARPTRPEPAAAERTTSGIAELDSLLGGGLPEASTTMVMGPSGIGKTTFGLQFLARCGPDAPGLLFGFYETPARLRAKADGVCKLFNGALDSGALEILWQPPTDGLLDAYGDRLLENVRRRGVRRLVIDGLDAFQSAASDATRLNQYLTALMNELRAHGVTTVYTLSVPNVTGRTIFDPLRDLTVPADNLIVLRYAEMKDRLHRSIAILKVRSSDFDSTVREYVTSSTGLLIDGSLDPDAAPGTREDGGSPTPTPVERNGG